MVTTKYTASYQTRVDVVLDEEFYSIIKCFCHPTMDTPDRGPDKKQQFYNPAERNKETNQFL